MPFLSGTSVVSLIIRVSIIVIVADYVETVDCVLRLLMKPVMLPTCVHLEFMAFPSRSSVPLLIINSKKEFDIVYGRINITIAAVKDFPPGSNVLFDPLHIEFAVEAFHCGHSGVLLICNVSFNVLVRNCEDESCILNDRYRITYKIVESLDQS
ncbi:hypothetical protein T02_12791 [Trichinella nativa]|uniref:Uncharacterized protein n=1 Tax=Trichinella nativa TaxID=6335 RepID=A0A0V1L100_9BILA|nr:hypothetical protein T02_12791 [Trichinella nativa]